MDAIPPVMRLKDKRKVYQSISSAFSRISSPQNSLEIATSIAGSPTADPPFLFFPSQEEKANNLPIYQLSLQ